MVGNNKFTILVLFAILLSSFSFALSPIYSGWIDDRTTQNDISFDISSNGVYCSNSDGVVLVYETECDLIDDLNICVREIRVVDEEYQAKIELYDNKYDFDIERVFDSSEIYYNEIVNVTVNITNTGVFDAENFIYTDEFPDSVEVISYDVGFVSNNIFSYKGDLEVGEWVNFTYAVKPVDKLKADLRSRIEIDNEEFYSDLTLIESVPPVSVVVDIPTKYNVVGDIINYTLYINNSMNLSTNISINLELPNNLQFLDGTRNVYLNYNMDSNGTMNQTLFIMCVYTGNEPVIVSTNVDNGVVFDLDDYYDYVTVAFPKFDYYTNIEDHYIRGELTDLEFTFTNRGLNVSDVYFSLNSNLLPVESVRDDFFAVNDTFTFDANSFMIPNKDGKYFVNVSYYFFTGYGQKIEESYLYNITVGKYSNVTIVHDVDLSAQSGDDVLVVVKLKNNVGSLIEGVESYDNFDSNLFVGGINANKISLPGNAQEVVYEYDLKMPYVYEDKSFDIVTHVSYTYGGVDYNLEKKSTIVVKPKEYEEKDFKISVTKSVESLKNLSIGDTILVDYKIQNKDSVPIRNIILNFPNYYGFEFLGSVDYVLDSLDPGEIIYLDGLEKLRPVNNGTFDIVPTELKFLDSSGFLYYVESNEIEDIDVLNSKSVDGPLISSKLLLGEFVTNGANFELIFENKGSSWVDLDFVYNKNDGFLSVGPGATKNILFTLYFNGNGNYSIPDVLGTYNYYGSVHNFFTKGIDIEYDDYVESESVVVSNNSLIEPNDDFEDLDYVDEFVVTETTKSSFLRDNAMVLSIISVSLILVVIIFYEIKKHKL